MIELISEGKLPGIASLLEDGVHTKHCLVPHPTMTPPNWNTTATGAWPGTHGIAGFNLPNPGDSLLDVHQASDSRDCEADWLWDTAARSGKRTIILNWPTSYPSKPDESISIAGQGIGPNDWRAGVPEHVSDQLADIADEQLFSVTPYREAELIELGPARNWQGSIDS